MTGRWSAGRERPRVAVVFHSRRGTMRRLAVAAAEGARARGAQVRLLRVADTAEDPLEPGMTASFALEEEVATPDDLLWADGLVLATPTYFGNVSAPFKCFLDSTARLWAQGLLADRVVTAMTSAECTYGGREATLLSLYQSVYHWGSWVLGADLGDTEHTGTSGNPYGLSAAYRRGSEVGPPEIRAAWAQGRRLAGFAARGPRCHPPAVPDTTRRPTRVTVVHHADGGAVRTLAQECAAGARESGAEVRLRRVRDAGPGNGPAPGGPWGAPRAQVVTAEDLAWADAVVFGAAARLGTLAAPLLDFAQRLEPVVGGGPLAGKAASAFAVTPRPHTGSESALLAFHQVLFHCGAVVAPPGYTDSAVFAAGGNPYGCAYALSDGAVPSPQVLAAVRHQGGRAAVVGHWLRRQPERQAGRSPYGAAGAHFEGHRGRAVM
ncbi:NAD(P)H-dependent oxidoreductase [Streptomyces sp. NPDC001508]|uniref:flavodoxin family protein n=1 Tax=Streptomyces sp. NPDC001508 TaxID=3154656 RepID=UPI003322D575